MTDTRVQEHSKSKGIKKKVAHELRELAIVTAYLALFFFAFATQKMFLLHQFGGALFNYGSALIKALIMAKVILIGQMAKLGKSREDKPLLEVSIYKAFIFALLVALFDFLEDVVGGLVHGERIADVVHKMGSNSGFELAITTVITFSLFIPFFALMETRRVMGEEQFSHLFLHRGK